MPETESLWSLLGTLVDERDQIRVDEEGEIVILGELDEQIAAKHVKRLVAQWGNRRRGKRGQAPLPGQMEMPEGGSAGDEPGAGSEGGESGGDAPPA